MKRLLAILALVLVAFPAFAIYDGSSLTPDITTEDFAPMVWMCGDRVLTDDNVEPGRMSDPGEYIIDRVHGNYAFEGEQISWTVLVMDKNGVPEKLSDVYATVGSTQGEGNDIEVNCNYLGSSAEVSFDSCNARIGEEHLTDGILTEGLAAYYGCTLTVESPDSMYGEYWVTVEAEDLDSLLGTMDENEYWFFNPVVAVSVDGELTFEDVRPGTSSYSETIRVGNDADEGSGVMMDMFISGTDFTDSSSSGARCPTTNQLSLDYFKYFMSLGTWDSENDIRAGTDALNENYIGIEYGDHFDSDFYDTNEIFQGPIKEGDYYQGNILSPGSEMSMTFRLDLPEPCNGDFDTGALYFWGEAI